jgi:CRISPR-associated protein Csd1
MFLEQLSEFASQMALPPPTYQMTPIRYELQIDEQGRYKGIVELLNEKNRPSVFTPAPSCKRSSGIRPKLLVDNGEYTLGIQREKSDSRRVQEQHRMYVEQISECAVVTREPSVIAVARYLQELDATQVLKDKPDLDPSANIAFKVDGMYPFELDPVKQYWAKKAAAASEGELLMQCLVCGEMRPPVERLPIVIKGIPGGVSTGLTLISANAAAFESYGLAASLIAPTCEACGERFGNALNELLRRKDTHYILSSLAYIFWVRDPAAGNLPMLDILNAVPEHVKNLLRSVRRGTAESTYLDDTAFYAATLSASGARVVLRDWIETSVGTVLDHLVRYFKLQEIQDTTGELCHFSLPSLINATINRDSQEKAPAQTGQALMHLALHGGQLPSSLLFRVIRRIRATRKVQTAQAALIKMALLSQQEALITDNERGHDMTTVNEDCADTAYLCGRLLAQLDHIQYRALGKVNATIVDRFYGTASTAPAVVFPRLLRGARPHLSTIRQKQAHPGNGYLDYLDKELTRLVDTLPPVLPNILSLEEQGMFAIGFYHQRAHYLSKRQDIATNGSDDNEIDTTDFDTTPENNENEME